LSTAAAARAAKAEVRRLRNVVAIDQIDRAGALSYFVGRDATFAKDTGALKSWTRCEVKNVAIFITGDSVPTMGHVVMTNKAGR
jgi:hypothetical protein